MTRQSAGWILGYLLLGSGTYQECSTCRRAYRLISITFTSMIVLTLFGLTVALLSHDSWLGIPFMSVGVLSGFTSIRLDQSHVDHVNIEDKTHRARQRSP